MNAYFFFPSTLSSNAAPLACSQCARKYLPYNGSTENGQWQKGGRHLSLDIFKCRRWCWCNNGKWEIRIYPSMATITFIACELLLLNPKHGHILHKCWHFWFPRECDDTASSMSHFCWVNDFGDEFTAIARHRWYVVRVLYRNRLDSSSVISMEGEQLWVKFENAKI